MVSAQYLYKIKPFLLGQEVYQDIHPVVGDLLSIRYIFQSGATGTTNCFNLPCTTPSAQLFYQVTAGNSITGRTGGTWKEAQTYDPLYLTVDRNLPRFWNAFREVPSGATAHIVTNK